MYYKVLTENPAKVYKEYAINPAEVTVLEFCKHLNEGGNYIFMSTDDEGNAIEFVLAKVTDISHEDENKLLQLHLAAKEQNGLCVLKGILGGKHMTVICAVKELEGEKYFAPLAHVISDCDLKTLELLKDS